MPRNVRQLFKTSSSQPLIHSTVSNFRRAISLSTVKVKEANYTPNWNNTECDWRMVKKVHCGNWKRAWWNGPWGTRDKWIETSSDKTSTCWASICVK